MKRKLDDEGVPAAQSTPSNPTEKDGAATSRSTATDAKAEVTFADMGLDARLLQALEGQRYAKPTLVQRQAIPLALAGRDVVCRAKTGSGKTAAYVLPILQGILKRKANKAAAETAALILVPTRELVEQVYKAIESLCNFCHEEIRVSCLRESHQDAVQRSLLSSQPDIVVCTPTQAWHHAQTTPPALDASKLSYLVLDEADLLLSYGHQEELERLAWATPKGVQTILMSATMTDEIDMLKTVFYRGNVPTLLDVEEADADGKGVTQLYTKCGEEEKFLLAYVIFKLKLVKGKCIIFVGDVDRSYRLKLFFEQFGIRSCILNSELPVNSRLHVVEEFNRNVYDIIIASDEREILDGEATKAEKKDDEKNAAQDDEDKEVSKAASGRPEKKRKVSKRDKEYGVSRGIDFKNVAAVLNFDLPTSAASYAHRIGRTARACKAGMALSFAVPKALYRKHVPTSTASAEHDEKILARILRKQAQQGRKVEAYEFDDKQVEAFRYRMNDALRAVTKVAVREARTRELRQELLKSEKLKRYFEENPSEVNHLRHDGELRTARQQAHLKHIPDYLLPMEGRKALTTEEQGGFVSRKREDGSSRHRRGRSMKRKGFKVRSRKSDPLKTFKAKRKAK